MGQVQRFGIFSPTAGLKESMPSLLLEEAYTPETSNCQIRWGELHRARMRSAALAVTTDGLAILRYHWLVKDSGLTYLLAFTALHVYYWDPTSSSWTLKFTCSKPVTYWSSVTYGGCVIATNGVDKVQFWNGTGSFANLGGSSGLAYSSDPYYMTTCRFVAAFENYLMFLYTTENGTVYPHRIRWSDLVATPSAVLTIDEGDAGALDVQGADHLTGYGHKGDNFIPFKERSHHRLWLTADEEVFNIAVVNRKVGTSSPDGIVNAKNGDLYFFGSDFSIRDYDLGEVSQDVDPIVKGVSAESVINIRAQDIDEYGELWWALEASDTGGAVGPAVLTGSGLDDMSSSGSYGASETRSYRVQIDAAATPDTFKWSRDGGSNWVASTVAITGAIQQLEDGVAVYFGATTGHTLNDYWDFTVTGHSNDTVLTLRADTRKWNVRDMPVSAFGYYSRGGNAYTWDGLPYTAWGDWDWEQWDAVEAHPGYLVDLCGDYSGYSWRAHDAARDAGADYEAYFVLSTDLTANQQINAYKRLLAVEVFFRPVSGGEAALSVKRDHEPNWQTLGTVDMDQQGEISRVRLPCDKRGRHFLLKWASSDRFFFIGAVFEFVLLGER